MAKTNVNTIFFNLYLLLLFFLIVSMAADAKLFDTILFGKARKQANNILRPQCKSVFGVRQGDTCFAVSQMFNLTLEFFDSLNPNLNCANLFVGEWLCVDGTPN